MLTFDTPLGHDRGDHRCSVCYSGFPEPHECGGLTHASEVTDDERTEEGTLPPIMDLQCDRCGVIGTRDMPEIAYAETDIPYAEPPEEDEA